MHADNERDHWWGLEGVLGWMVTSALMSVFEMAVDTVFVTILELKSTIPDPAEQRLVATKHFKYLMATIDVCGHPPTQSRGLEIMTISSFG